MATEVGSDIALIQDEDMLRKMWQQTEDFGKKKEIRMRMYKLREQRLKEFYTTGEMIQTETTSKRSSTRTHTESITDRGFMTMKTKEIRDSESPTEEYQRQTHTNKNYYASSKNDESDGGGGGNRALVQTEHVSSAVVPANEEYTTSSRSSSVQQSSSVLSSSTSSRWESSSSAQTVVAVSADEVVQKADVHLDSSKYIINDDRQQLTYDNKSNVAADNKATEYDGTNAVRETVVERDDNNSQYSTRHGRESKSYSSNVDSSSNKVVVTEHAANVVRDSAVDREDSSQKYSSSNRGEKVIETRTTNTTGGDVYESVSENTIKNNDAVVDNKTYNTTSDVSRTAENVDVTTTDHNIINELQKLDSYLSTQHSTTDTSTKSNSVVSNDERPIKRAADERPIKKAGDRSADTSRERTEGQYETTYQHSYQPPRISVDVSPSHEAFARSLRSTPERTSPSPNRERGSPERRFKSASPEKYRASPEKSASPPKSLKSATRRKLSSTQTKGLSKKRANTPTRAGDKYDSSDDSDCSGATHGTYDKYKSHDAKRALFKEETKITTTTTVTSKYGHKSPSVSPVRREKSPGYSSEGSVAKEVRKSSSKVRAGSSHESSPERSAFKPVKNYKAPTQTHTTKNVSQDNKVNTVTREENNVYTNNLNTTTKNNKVDVSNFIKVIKPDVEETVDEDEESTVHDVSDSRKESVQKNFITEEQIHSSSERADNTKITKEPARIAETDKPTREKSPSKSPTKEIKSDRNEFFVNEQINVTIERTQPIREKSPSKSPTKEYKSEQEEFIVNEKINVTKERTDTNDVETLKPRERSPVKEFKPETKDAHKTRPTAKSPEKKSSIPSSKSTTPSKNAPATKAIPSSIEKTPSKSNLVHRDSRDNLSQHKTVKKDLSREKIDTKIARNDSKTLLHKNSKDNVTPKPVVKKSSQELIINKNLKENVTSKTVVKKSSQELILNKSHKENVAPRVVTTKKSSQELLVNKSQKENITPKTVVKKPSQELLLDKKTTISFRNKVTSPESKPKSQEPIKSTVDKKETVSKLKPTISPQSSQKKLGIVKPSTVTKTPVSDYKRGTENSNLKKIPTTTVTKPKTFTGTTRPAVNDTPSLKGTKTYSKTTSTYTARSQIKKTVPAVANKTARVEVTTRKVAGQRPSNDLEDELPPNHFESDTDLDDSPDKPKYAKNQRGSSAESSESESSSSSEDEEDTRKIKELDNIRIEAEEEYGRKMTNKDGLLNVIVQLPPSSRESSPEYSARFGQPYCSVSDDASLPRYADVVSEPEDVNDYRMHGNRYDVVTDLDEETNVTVADRVSKFLHNISKQEENIRTAEVPQSPRAVRKAKQLFESIAKGQGVEDIGEDDEDEPEVIGDEIIEVHESPKNVTSAAPSPVNLLTRKISGAADYKSRKDFFEKKTTENKPNSNDRAPPHSSYSPKVDRPAHSSEPKTAAAPAVDNISAPSSPAVDDRSAPSPVDKPAAGRAAAPRTRSPQSKDGSPDRTATKSPARSAIQTETFDVKIEEINKSRRLSGSKTVKDRKSAFERHEVAKKPAVKDSSDTAVTAVRRHQTPTSPAKTDRISERYMKSVADTNSAPVKRVTSPNRNKKPSAVDSPNRVDDTPSKRVGSKSPDRKRTETPVVNKAKSPEKSAPGPSRDDGRAQRRVQETQRTSVTSKTEFGVTVKSTPAPKSAVTTTKSTAVSNTDEESQIEEIFDLQVLEIMLEKAVGYDRRRRIRAQIRVVKRQLESTTSKETVTTTRTTNVNKSARGASPTKSQKQNNVVAQKTTTEYVKRTEVKKERSVSPQKSYPASDSRSPSPQKSLRSVDETRSPLPAQTKTVPRPAEKSRSPSPRKTSTAPVEKVRSPSPQKSAPVEKSRSPSPKKMSVAKQQQHPQDARTNKYEKSSYRNSTSTTASTTVASSTKVKSEQQVGSSAFQEQNVTDLITSSYGVGPTDDNGRPLFGLRALRKTNTSQQINANDSSAHRQVDTYDSAVSSSDQKTSSSKPRFGLKALQGDYDTSSSCTTTTVRESSSSSSSSRTVHQKVSEQKGGVDQLITDHKGKPLFGLKALQSIGKNEEEPIYDDMPEPPVSPQLKELVQKHEKHAKESSKLESQPRQKPKAKFRDSFILDNKDEGLYSTFQQNGYTEPNSITLRSIIKKPEDDQSNETVIKSKSQSTVFQSKSVMRSDGSGNVSVTQDFLKGEVSSVNDQEPSGKVTRGHYTYQSPDNADSKKGIAKVTTVTTAIGGGGGRDTNESPEITDITEEFDESDRTDGNKSSVKRSRTSDKFETIQKRFSQESFDQDSRRSSRETNGYEKTEESTQSTPRSSLVRGDSIKALQHKFQQATVSSSLKQNKSGKSDSSSNSTRQVEEKTVTSQQVVNTSKSSGTTSRSFLDDSSRVTDVQDVLTRMRNADLVVESGDTDEDIEARALLNKFLGASVILHGMEQAGRSPTSSPAATTTTTTTASASLVNQVEKQRAQKSPVIKNNLSEQELDNIWDEKQLQILLESSPDYNQRRKIRARLRQIMAEHKACADIVALTSATADGGTKANDGSTANEVTESNTTSVSSKTESATGSYVKTEVHTRTTTSSNRLTKANSVSASPFAKFQQLERQNSAPNSQSRPCYKFTDPALARSASSIKDRLLNWVRAQTKEYKNLQITNFSTCWSDGLAFCALIHHFYPEAFDYYQLKPENRRENFEIAFKVAEDEAGIAPLLDVEDMVVMRKPDWKCVFTYVQTFYRRFHNSPEAAKPPSF